jgi:transposase
MVAARRIIALSVASDQRRTLVEVSRSRTEPANRVERARIILAYLDEPSAYGVAQRMGLTRQTVKRCLERAAELGVVAALDDRAGSGRDPAITAEARAWLVALACAKPTQFRYPHELWTTRLLAAHGRDHGPGAGHPSLAKLVQGTVCKILAAHEVKPHKVRYYLERRDPEFEPKMAEVLCVYREVELRRAASGGNAEETAITVISYDEKPGIQAIATTVPDLRPVPGAYPTISRDHEYKRQGTVTLMAGIDLMTGQVHALVKDRHAVASSSNSSTRSMPCTPPRPRSRSSSTITPLTYRRKPRLGSPRDPKDASSSCSLQSTAPGSTSSRVSLPRRLAPCSATSASIQSTS